MEKQEMNELQRMLLDMLIWFHAYCEEHELTYFMVGGTMLGAARHKGFIPWDNDLDVGMPRADYERFSALAMKQDPTARYIAETIHMGRPDYDYPHAKVYDTATTLVENKRHQTRRGIYIDVFPIDGMGNTLEEGRETFRPLGVKLDILAAAVCAPREGRAPLKNLAVRAFSLVPDFIYDQQRAMLDIDRRAQERTYEKCDYVANVYGIKRMKEVMPRRAIGTPKLYEFEGYWFYGVEQPELYLKCLFGNWRQLPPKDQQVSIHDYLSCDLHTPWRESDGGND